MEIKIYTKHQRIGTGIAILVASLFAAFLFKIVISPFEGMEPLEQFAKYFAIF